MHYLAATVLLALTRLPLLLIFREPVVSRLAHTGLSVTVLVLGTRAGFIRRPASKYQLIAGVGIYLATRIFSGLWSWSRTTPIMGPSGSPGQRRMPGGPCCT